MIHNTWHIDTRMLHLGFKTRKKGEGFQKTWLVGCLCLCGLLGPYDVLACPEGTQKYTNFAASTLKKRKATTNQEHNPANLLPSHGRQQCWWRTRRTHWTGSVVGYLALDKPKPEQNESDSCPAFTRD